MKHRDALLGAWLGDVLGAPYEFSMPGPKDLDLSLRSVFGHPPGAGTDDTEQTILVAESIVACRINPANQRRHLQDALLHWYKGHPADVGTTTSAALNHYANTGSLPTRGSASNGSLMRNAPYGIAYGPHFARLFAAFASVATHVAADAVRACAAHAEALSLAVGEDPLDQVIEKLESALALMGPPDSMGSVSVALDLTRRSLDSGSYDEGIRWVIEQGGDTDTNACIAGSLLAAVHGLSDSVYAKQSQLMDLGRFRFRSQQLLLLADQLLVVRQRA